MAYFDSPKNKAMWERELNSLRAEKERRANGEYPGANRMNEEAKEASMSNPNRVKISYKELLREENQANKAKHAERRAREKSRQIDMHLNNPTKGGPSK